MERKLFFPFLFLLLYCLLEFTYAIVCAPPLAGWLAGWFVITQCSLRIPSTLTVPLAPSPSPCSSSQEGRKLLSFFLNTGYQLLTQQLQLLTPFSLSLQSFFLLQLLNSFFPHGHFEYNFSPIQDKKTGDGSRFFTVTTHLGYKSPNYHNPSIYPNPIASLF